MPFEGRLHGLLTELGDLRDLPWSCQSPAWLQDKSSKPLSLPADIPKGEYWERRDPSVKRMASAQNQHAERTYSILELEGFYPPRH